MKETLLHKMVDGILVAVHSDAPPSDADWDSYLAAASAKIRGNLIVTDGAGPNATQRAKIAAIPGANEFPSAVVTTSIVARGIVTAISWSGKKIQAFAPQQLHAAFEYLNVDESTRSAMMRQIATMKAKLAGGGSIELMENSSQSLGHVSEMMDYVITSRLASIRAKVDASRRAR